MSVRGWVLVQTEAGRARAVCDTIAAYQHPSIRVLSADTVTGPYDVLAQIEADDVDALTVAAEDAVSGTIGVEHITTSVVTE